MISYVDHVMSYDHQIQQQVMGSCGPQEYRQHQLIQWDQLLGYIKQYQDEQLRPPSGLFIDGNNGLVLLLGRQVSYSPVVDMLT